jgi:5-methylcytosine-specific restriction endonuclease McrA
MAGKSKPGKIHLRIVEVMKRFPEGVSGGQIRQALEQEGLEPAEHTHLDRRKRDLKKWFLITKNSATLIVNGKSRKVVLYKYLGSRESIVDQGQPSRRDRAEIIRAAYGRCQMCGQTVERHGVTLVVDHKKPRDWGGTNDRENLWAICEECNSGKKAYFSSLQVDADLMKSVTAHESVHVRIGELLKAVGIGNRTSSQLIDIVADQDDWQKRLRELRYPVIGWKIDIKLYRSDSGKKQCDYILKSYQSWPDDPSGAIRRFESERQKRSRPGAMLASNKIP